MNQSLPIRQNERSIILDILRGIALFGVLLANSASFSLFVFMPEADQTALPTKNVDDAISAFHFIFIDGKFYSLFSLLFGIGFSIILLRAKTAGDGLYIFYRRIMILVIIGTLHITFLWDGDILLLYAFIGCFLPLFRNLTDRTLLTTAVALIFSPLLFDLLKVLSHGKLNMGHPFSAKGQQLDLLYNIRENDVDYLSKGNYTNLLRWLRGGFYYRIEHLLASNRIPKVLALFLTGYVVGRRMIYVKLEENTALLKNCRRYSFLLGIPASVAYAYFYFDGKRLPAWAGLADTASYALSVIPLSVAYASTICLLWISGRWKKLLLVFAPVGRMALTNYLMQTIISSLIYYGIGLGLGGKVGPSGFILIAIGIFAIQLIYSNLWLRYFNYGPAEWVWRQFTYGKRIPFIKPASSIKATALETIS